MSDFRDQVKMGDAKTDPGVLARASDRMSKSRARLMLQQPFYGVLLSMIDFIPEAGLPTMATDGSRVYFNPEFTMSLTDDEVYGVLLHEISHCIYLHCTQKRRLNRDPHRWNVAADFAINLEIRSMGYTLPSSALIDSKFADMNAEQIYDDLPKDCSNMKTLDTHIENSDSGEWDDMEEKIISAYEMTKHDTKSQGKLPGGLKRWLDNLRKAKVNWARVFHRYVGQALAKDDYSYTRVNRRFVSQDIYVPDLRNHIIGNVVIGVDTSGSIGRDQLEQFGAEMAKISHLVDEVTMISCDAQIHEVVKVRKFQNFIKNVKFGFKGGGGTDFRPVFDLVKERKWQPELLIYLTDTYGSFPEKHPGYPVLWCITTEAGTVPWGQSVYIPNKESI